MRASLRELCVRADQTLRDAIEQIDRNRKGVVLVLNREDKLTDLLTDGDVRRAVLAGIDLGTPLRSLLNRRKSSPYVAPVAARPRSDAQTLLRIMQRYGIRHVPLVGDDGRVQGLVTQEDLLPGRGLPLQALIMAGGRGTRLLPLTAHLPKPMLPVGNRPLLERTIAQLRDAGVQRVHIATHYKPEKITEHFGDGNSFGVQLSYLAESQALGTAGALGLLEHPQQPVLVVNGDILTDLDFRAMLDYHAEHRAELTVATRRWEVRVPYGVVECRGARVRRLNEKPELCFFVNAGIYLVEPSALELVPRGQPFDMTDLIGRLLEHRRTVVGFPILEYWTDIGQHADYHRAQDDVRNGRVNP